MNRNRRLRDVFYFILVAIFLIAAPAAADDIGANRSDLIKSLLPTVVNVTVRKDEPPANASPVAADAATSTSTDNPNVKIYVGSGFVIDPSGLIVTNYHVIENAFEITVTLSDGTRLPATVKSGSRVADLALLNVKADHPLMAAHWGDSDHLQVGDQVFAAGNPFGVGLSISAGIVSALNRDIENSPYDNYIQTDATINHGNSGGPLFDMRGNVVGVDSAIYSPTTGSAGVGFAMPSSSAQFVIDRLEKYGWVRPSWIGVKVQQVTPDIAEAMGMDQPEGAIVSWTLPNGPAAKAGLAIGDVILRFDGMAPTDERALLRDIVKTPIGNTITFVVRRDGREQKFSLTTMEWPRNQWEARDAPTPVDRPKIIVPHNLGLTLTPIAPDQRSGLGLLEGMEGVLISGVAPDSDPAHRGVVAGDVILRVQQTRVSTTKEVQSGIDAARAEKRDFVIMLILPKVRDTPGPRWIPLRLTDAE